MQLKLWLNALAFLACLCISHSRAEEEVICTEWKQVQCNDTEKIRVHDVIYGHVVGRNECNTKPKSDCIATNGFCEVAEKTEGRNISNWLRANETINPPPCVGTGIYIIIEYSCLKDVTLSGENFALEKPTEQSTTLGSRSASEAVDGDKNNHWTSCTHTAANKQNPWWRVDLEQRIAVTHVKIVNRNILGERLCGFEIRVGDSLKNNGTTNPRCGSQQHIPSRQEGIVSCVPEVIGRYVTIFIPGDKKILTLCEVEVYGTSVLGGNFALEKPTEQSTTHGGQSASKAVDGEKNNYWTSCTHTAANKQNPWWRVDLEQRIAVTHVKIVNRNILGERLCGFEIRVGDSLKNNGTTNPRCGSQQHIPSRQEGIVACVPEVIGRYVTIFIPGDKKILTLCEVEVYGISVLGNRSLTRIELVGSNLPYQGYIVNNTETLCNPTWSMNDASVACIQLGYPGVDESHWNNSYPGNITSVNKEKTVKRRYTCLGAEGSLNVCPQKTDGEDTCLGNAINVTCQPYIRLAGSDIPLEGRLEVIRQGEWGTVCVKNQRNFASSARVACRELGFHDVIKQHRWAGEPVKKKIWLKDVNCGGEEKSLVFCPHDNWNSTGCDNTYDRFVKCSICSNGLLEDKVSFPDFSFYASAARLPGYGPSSGRLYSSQPWCLPESISYENQFLEITLPGIFSLSAVATVGGELGYVTSYMLSYMVSGYTWNYASVGTQKLIFGNTNDETHNVIRRDLDSPIRAEKVRFIPKTWQRVPCLRVELCGEEIPRCNLRNITVNNLTSNSIRISWLPPRLYANTTQNENYSVRITSDSDQDIQYFKITGQRHLFIPNLLPYHRYTYVVKAIGLEGCFDDELKLYFETKQAAPSGPPRNVLVKRVDSTEVTVDWSPPFSNQINGIITSYQLCYSTERLQESCKGNGTIWHIESAKTFVKSDVSLPANISVQTFVRLYGLLPATAYFFRIRARTEAGRGPNTNEYKTITSSGDLLISNEKNTTSHSFSLQLHTPQKGYRYVQIIVVALKDTTLPFPPYTYTSDKISSANESVGTLKPYVTAQLTVDEVNDLNTFVVGDGKNYGHPARRRRGIERFPAGFDDIAGHRRTDRSEGSRKPTLFYNRPLSAGSIYSAFQRTFVDGNTYYSSSWSQYVRTNIIDNKGSVTMNSSSETAKWTGIGIAGAVVFINILVMLIFLSRKLKNKGSREGSSNKTMRENNAGNKNSHFNEVVQHDNYDPNQSFGMEIVAAGASRYETMDCTLDKNTNVETVEEMYNNANDPSGSQEFSHVIPTAKGNLHADSSTYMSLSDNRGPESVYQTLQSSEITADPQYSNDGDDESLTYMSLHENREAPNVYQSLQHAREITV